MQEKAKKKADYTNSAVKLCNPDQVRDLTVEKRRLENLVAACQEKLKTNKAYLQLQDHERALGEIAGKIKKAIDDFGSFQDIEAGVYALKYKRISKVYHVDPFKEHYAKYATAVVEETINAKALEGIIKGGLIEEADLKMHKVITEDVGYAYYVR